MATPQTKSLFQLILKRVCFCERLRCEKKTQFFSSYLSFLDLIKLIIIIRFFFLFLCRSLLGHFRVNSVKNSHAGNYRTISVLRVECLNHPWHTNEIAEKRKYLVGGVPTTTSLEAPLRSYTQRTIPKVPYLLYRRPARNHYSSSVTHQQALCTH
uniref:Uncharacterized protein n=1 Tax=Cacopsylla melanoneura TaxID=428564 RepID=A0A8D8T659_9HEMI